MAQSWTAVIEVTSQRAEHDRPRTPGCCADSSPQGSATGGSDAAGSRRLELEAIGDSPMRLDGAKGRWELVELQS